MCDDADIAQDAMERDAELAAKQRDMEARFRETLPFTQFCAECGETLPECRARSKFVLCRDCQELAEREARLRKINGAGAL
jgi:RNA polymerase-binding transcription factor DksA